MGICQSGNSHKFCGRKLCNITINRNSARFVPKRATQLFTGRPHWLQVDGVGFADGDLYLVRLLRADKAVIPHELAHPIFLPCSAVPVLITEGIVLGEGSVPVVGKFCVPRKGVLLCPPIIPGVFLFSPIKVVCSADFQNIAALIVDIMTNIQKFFVFDDFHPLLEEKGRFLAPFL